MTDYAKHTETYVFDMGIDDKIGNVRLTYPQVLRLGEILANLRTKGVDGERTIIRAEDGGILAVTRDEA